MSGPPPPFHGSRLEAPFLDAFRRQVRDRPGAEALWSRAEGRRLDFRRLAERIDHWRRRLRRLPGPPEAPLALALGNGTAFVELVLAAFAEGIPAVAMDASRGADGTKPLADRLQLCRRLGLGRLLHRPGSSLQSEAGEAPGGGWEAWDDGVVLTRLEGPLAEAPSGTALVKLTSGSTGRPVAACFGQAQLWAGIRQIGEGMELDRRDRVVLAIPLSHSYGFDNGLSSLAVLGTALVLEPSIYPGDLLRAVVEGEGTFLPLVPPLVRGLARSRWPETPTLRRVICAGGLLPREFADHFHHASGLRVHEFYGSTETGGICFERHPEDPAAVGTVGQPLPGVKIELEPLDRESPDAEPGADGSGGRAVVVRSPANLLGHLGAPGAERPSMPTEPSPQYPAVRTGDLAVLTAEGRLRLVGRSTDLLNVGGRKVAVSSIEEALRRLDGVDDAAVIGVPDPMRGDRPVAFVVAESWPLALDAVPARLRPRELRRLEGLPHDGRGKLDRAALHRLALERSSEPDARPANRPDSRIDHPGRS